MFSPCFRTGTASFLPGGQDGGPILPKTGYFGTMQWVKMIHFSQPDAAAGVRFFLRLSVFWLF
jgi:hypothetical protein